MRLKAMMFCDPNLHARIGSCYILIAGLPAAKADGAEIYHRFFSLVLLLGWIGYGPSFLSSYGLLSWPVPLIVAFAVIGGGSPTFAALITARREYGKDGPASLFRQFNPKRAPGVWFVASLALPAGISLSVVGLWLAFGNS